MSTARVGTWNYPTAIRFGAGRTAELPQALAELGVTRPLIVTDRGLADLPPVAAVSAALGGAPHAVYAAVSPDPTDTDVMGGVEALRAHGCDGVIALGGGSGLDAAKAVALMAHQTRPIWDFIDEGDNFTRVDVAAMVPCVAIPTTAGTGSEVGRASVIRHEAARAKHIIFHPRMLPGRVIADPALTVGLPAHLTAATGMDALSHNLEAFCAPGFHPQADGIAAEGIRLVQRALPQATADGADLDARADMLAASLMGATAFQKGLGGMHGISHVVGARTHQHHGLLNAIVMPYVLVHNRDAIADRLGDLARAMGLTPTFDGFLAWVLDLRASVGIPHTLDLRGEDPDTLAEHSVLDPSTGGNPVPLDAAAYARIYRAAASGAIG